MTIKSKLLTSVAAVITAVSMIFTSATPVSAATGIEKCYLTQEKSNTCTLASAAMLFRRKAYLDGSSNYNKITEKTMKDNKNWSGGLVNSIKFKDTTYGLNMKGSATCYYSMMNNGYKLNSTSGAESVKKKLKQQLDKHPEGIVLYLYNNPSKGKTKWQHAVLLTRYNNDTFYCLNPGTGKSSEVNLVSTFKKKSGSSTINGLLSNAVKIWYVTSDNNTTSKYTITYKLDGGTNNGNNPTEYTSSSSISLSNPSRVGYVFNGWFIDGTKTRVTSIEPGTTGNLTLVAKWSPFAYYVSFDPNGGNGSMSKMTCSYGSNYNLTANTFTRQGYTFTGWNTKANGTGYAYYDGSKISNLSSKLYDVVTLYAQWQINPENVVVPNTDYDTNDYAVETETTPATYDNNQNYPSSTAPTTDTSVAPTTDASTSPTDNSTQQTTNTQPAEATPDADNNQPSSTNTEAANTKTYYIASRLDDNYAITAGSDNLKLGLLNTTSACGFYLDVTSDGYFRIISKATGLALQADTYYSSAPYTGDHVKIRFAAPGNSDYQKWDIVTNSSGYNYIINKANGLYLDVQDAWATSGNNVNLFERNDGYYAQDWVIYSN